MGRFAKNMNIREEATMEHAHADHAVTAIASRRRFLGALAALKENRLAANTLHAIERDNALALLPRLRS